MYKSKVSQKNHRFFCDTFVGWFVKEFVLLCERGILYFNLYRLDKKADIKSKKIWCLFACMKKGCTFAFRKCRRKTSVFLQHMRTEKQIVYTVIELEEKIETLYYY